MGLTWVPGRLRLGGTLLALGLAAALGGCTGGATVGQGPTATPADATPATTASPGPSGQAPNLAVPVDWGDGRNPPGMKQGVPNPPGWYAHAFGGSTTEKVLYLTFDDGPARPYTPQLLDLLARHQSRATFFVVGGEVELLPDLVRQAADAGNAVGDHTQSHADLVSLPREKVRAELTAVQREVGGALGPCMRPPYGLIDTTVADVSAQLGLVPILWTGHAADWEAPPAAQIVSRIKAATAPGAVILLHDGGGDRATTVAAVRELLPWWRDQGYTLQTVPACRPGSSG